MKIIASNALASIQDIGRFGYRSMGVGTNGAMDPWALQAGNALLKNLLDDPAIEITLGSFSVEFSQATCFCLTGGIYETYLDDTRIFGYWRVHAQAGQVLKLVRPLSGMHTYLCVQGGFDIAKVLGSASTNLKGGFGGFDGRFLKQGDTLAIKSMINSKPSSSPLPIIGVAPLHSPIKPFSSKASHSPLSHSSLSHSSLSQLQDSNLLDSSNQHAHTLNQENNDAQNIIRVIKNSEYDAFTDSAKQQFEQQIWKVDTSSNRMGYRCVADTPLKLKTSIEMSSHGVAAGMIQVPPQGQPIVLMADAQTTGGYPKIATVINADIGLMAQTRFGQHCRFKLISLKEALQAYQDRQRYIERIKRYANDN